MSSTQFSVFIPRVFSNIREERISMVFRDQNIGETSKIDLIKKTNAKGDRYNMAFVHFDSLFDTDAARSFKQDVEDPEFKTKLVYEDPWFWLVLPFEEKKPVEQHQQPMVQPHLNYYAPVYQPQQQQFQPYSMGHGMMMMTSNGPMWVPDIPAEQLQLVPPQVAYGNRKAGRGHPRKRINVPKKAEPADVKNKEEKKVSETLEEGEEA